MSCKLQWEETIYLLSSNSSVWNIYQRNLESMQRIETEEHLIERIEKHEINRQDNWNYTKSIYTFVLKNLYGGESIFIQKYTNR